MQTKKDHSRIAVTAVISAAFIFILSIQQLSAEPYVHYHLDGDGTDASSNGLDLTVNEDQLTWVEGVNGQAAFIKAGDNNNPLSMNEMHGSGDWTFEAWVKLESFDFNGSIMQAGQFKFGFSNYIFSFSAFERTAYRLSYSFIFIGRWFHCAGVYRDGESIQLFINGKKVAENVPSYNHDFSNKHSLYIGRDEWGDSHGEFTVDEVVIHNEALEPENFIGMQYNVDYPVYTINGHIKDSSSGEGLPGAVVTADPGEFIVATDSNGDFTIDLPWDGEFNVSVNKSNYTSTSPQNVVVTPDVPVTVDFALERFSTSPTIAYYHFDGDGKDASGNGYDFTVNEHVTWTDGIQGKAAVLDSIPEKIEYPLRAFETSVNRPVYPGSGDFTCEILMYFHDPKGRFPMFNFSNRPYGLYTMWYRSVEYSIWVYLYNYYDSIEFKVPLTDYLNEWIHIALVYRYKQSFQFYINGELIAEEESDFIPDIFPWATFSFNSSSGKYIVDEVRISNTALSPDKFLFMETNVEDSASPSEFSITGNYPNPFNPTTTIEFTIPEAGHINLGIYNITGQKIRELVADTMPAGTHSVMWDGRDEDGMMVSSGIYISSLKSGEHVTAKRMLLMK